MVEFGHFPGCSTHMLEPPLSDASRLYQSAFVFPLPPHVEQLVNGIRFGVPVDAPSDDQLRPHITLLYLGLQRPAFLSTLIERLAEMAPRLSAEVWCSGTGEFSVGDGSRNWHLTIQPRATLCKMQQSAAQRCMALGWTVASRFMGDNYTPHITIWDRMAKPRQALPPPIVERLTNLKFAIQSPLVVGRRR
jgi:2'-5' RNA ligase